jgi:hypothetical protein
LAIRSKKEIPENPSIFGFFVCYFLFAALGLLLLKHIFWSAFWGLLERKGRISYVFFGASSKNTLNKAISEKRGAGFFVQI